MIIYPKVIERLVGESGVGFNNAKNYPEIKEKIINHGYTDEQLDKLIQLNKTLDEKYHDYERYSGEQLEATTKLNEAFETELDLAMIFRMMVLKVFSDDTYRGYRSQLGVDGDLKRNFDGFIEKSILMYDTVAKKPEILEFLVGHDVTNEKLLERLSKLEELKKLNETQEKAKGKALDSRKARDDAYIELKAEWKFFKYVCRRVFKNNTELLKIVNIKPHKPRKKPKEEENNQTDQTEQTGQAEQTEQAEQTVQTETTEQKEQKEQTEKKEQSEQTGQQEKTGKPKTVLVCHEVEMVNSTPEETKNNEKINEKTS